MKQERIDEIRDLSTIVNTGKQKGWIMPNSSLEQSASVDLVTAIPELLDEIEAQAKEIAVQETENKQLAENFNYTHEQNTALKAKVERKHDLLLKVSYCGDIMEAMYNNHEPLRDEFDKEIKALKEKP